MHRQSAIWPSKANPFVRSKGLDRAIFPALRVVPDGRAEGSAYRQVASGLRRAIAAGQYPAGQRLPTEAELVSATGLSRQTVRRAFQELVTDGAIYRVRGRGTFAVPGDGKYLRSFGSVDDLMALSLDTEMQVVEPLHVLASLAAARSLQVDDDMVMSMSFVRLHEGSPVLLHARARADAARPQAGRRFPRWPSWPSRAPAAGSR